MVTAPSQRETTGTPAPAGAARTVPPPESGGLSNCEKLLSHRGRGFGYSEATPEAVRAALESGIRYLEFDTRVGADGVIHVRHGTRIRARLALLHVRAVSEQGLAMHGVARLADLLKVAAEIIDKKQTICLDIKDFGFEREHVELVEQFGLGDQTVFVSWIPQALARLRTIAPKFPLILSHINLRFLRFGADMVDVVLAARELRIFDYIVLGPRAIDQPLRHQVGFQHAVLARNIPDHFVRLLSQSGGGICVPRFCVCDELDDWCLRHSLGQWVFTANDADTYERLRKRRAVQVIFSDDPLHVAGERIPGIS
jgi:glycerophosphoryl diester phosphodiesterase